jgi:5'-3' exonuclease
VEAAGFEADDVCATVARRWTDAGRGPVDVVSGDRDLLQLVDDDAGVRVVYVGKGVRDAPAMTAADLRSRYGVADGRAYLHMSVLRGDPSDGLPGIGGIGEKSAADLLRQHGDLHAVMAAAADPSRPMSPARRTRLVASLDYVVKALTVVTCVDDAPVEPAEEDSWLLGTPAEDGRVEEFGQRWGCSRQVARLAEVVRSCR